MKSTLLLVSIFAGVTGLNAQALGEELTQSSATDSAPPAVAENEDSNQFLTAVQRLFRAQMAIYDNTKRLHKTLTGKKPSPIDKKTLARLAWRMNGIIVNTNKLLIRLDADGASPVFIEFFQQLSDDMRIVQRRLKYGDLGHVTQVIEMDIISSCKELIEALRKART